MQEWEYLVVSLGSAQGETKPYAINGQQVADWGRGISMYDYADELGEQGWELVSATDGIWSGSPELIFKRQKP